MSKMMMSEEMKSVPAAPSPLRRLLCWEGFLLAVTLAVFMVNALASPGSLISGICRTPRLTSPKKRSSCCRWRC